MKELIAHLDEIVQEKIFQDKNVQEKILKDKNVDFKNLINDFEIKGGMCNLQSIIMKAYIRGNIIFYQIFLPK